MALYTVREVREKTREINLITRLAPLTEDCCRGFVSGCVRGKDVEASILQSHRVITF